MKKTFIALILTLVLAVSSFGQLAKPIGGVDFINLAFTSTTTDTVYWYGPYDVSDCWTLGGTGLAQGYYPGNSNDSVSIDLNILTEGSSVAGAATYTVSAYLCPVPVVPGKNKQSQTAGSGAYGLTFSALCGADTIALTAISADADTASSELHINRDIVGSAPPYLVLRVNRANDKPTDTKGYIRVDCVSRKRFK